MKKNQIPVRDGIFYAKSLFLITGPAEYLSDKIVDNHISLSDGQLNLLFLNAMDIPFPFFKEEKVFVIYPARDDEVEGEYIQFEYKPPKYTDLTVTVRVQIKPTGHDAVTLPAHVASKLLDDAVKRQLLMMY